MNVLSIVDAHVHWWNPARFRYSWLDALPTLNRAFLPPDYTSASAPTNVSKIVFVESGCEPKQSLDEVDWISSLSKNEPRLRGIVTFAPIERGEAVLAELEALASRPLVKGVRRNLQVEMDAGYCLRPEFVAGVKSLEKFGFTFDLCIRPEQLRSVSELVRCVPQVTFVLDHLGKPNVRDGKREPWATDLKSLAAHPNVVCKISGLTTEADCQKWQPADLKFYFNRALECFGPDRILFGSDWPVATLATDYSRWIQTVEAFLSCIKSADQTKFFQTNAERIYRV